MMPESPRKTNIPEQLGRPERRDPPMRERLLNEVLLHVAAQLRTALGGMHIAVGRLAPPDRRDRDAVLDRDAALLNHNYYSLLRLANNLSNAPMLLSDEPLLKENTDIVEWLAGLCRQAIHLGVAVQAEHGPAAGIALRLQQRGGGGAVHPAGHGDEYALVVHHAPRKKNRKYICNKYVYNSEIPVNN